MNLAEFLTARIDETERYIDPERDKHGPPIVEALAWNAYGLDGAPEMLLAFLEAARVTVSVWRSLEEFAFVVGSVRWHEAKAYEVVVRSLAAVWSAHADYRPEWAA